MIRSSINKIAFVYNVHNYNYSENIFIEIVILNLLQFIFNLHCLGIEMKLVTLFKIF